MNEAFSALLVDEDVARVHQARLDQRQQVTGAGRLHRMLTPFMTRFQEASEHIVRQVNRRLSMPR